MTAALGSSVGSRTERDGSNGAQGGRARAAAGPTLPLRLGDGPFAVTTRGLVKRFGSITALDGLNLEIPEGAVYVLVGPNGAGKSTLMRVLLNLACRDAGEVSVMGVDPRGDGAGVRSMIGYVPEGHDFGYPWMTVERLLHHYAAYFPTWDAAYADRLAKAYDIDLSRKCNAHSKGQRQRVQLLLALATRPPVLLLDEPTDGLDHVVRDRTLEILSEHLADSPTTALISTHRVYEIERLVDHVGVLSGGRLLGQLPREDLQRGLRRYVLEVPETWAGTAELEADVVRRSGTGRDLEWTVWGDEERVTEAVENTGAVVRDVVVLSIDDAATALLSRGEAS